MTCRPRAPHTMREALPCKRCKVGAALSRPTVSHACAPLANASPHRLDKPSRQGAQARATFECRGIRAKARTPPAPLPSQVSGQGHCRPRGAGRGRARAASLSTASGCPSLVSSCSRLNTGSGSFTIACGPARARSNRARPLERQRGLVAPAEHHRWPRLAASTSCPLCLHRPHGRGAPAAAAGVGVTQRGPPAATGSAVADGDPRRLPLAQQHRQALCARLERLEGVPIHAVPNGERRC